MTVILNMLLAAMTAVVFENVIFTTAFGTSTLIELTKKRWNILSFGGFITEFAVLSSLIAYFFERLLGDASPAKRIMPIIYILSLGFVYIVTLIAIRAASKKAFSVLKKYVHLSAFNCTVLSALFNNSILGGSIWQRVLYSAGIGVGFALAAYIMSINYDKLSSDDVPVAFRGFPIYILYIGIISMLIYAINR